MIDFPEFTPTPDVPTTEHESWTFTAKPGEAHRAYLVLDGGGPSRWVEMQPVVGRRGAWDANVILTPGRYRARYFTAQNGSVVNHGGAGLLAKRTAGHCPGVEVAPAEARAA